MNFRLIANTTSYVLWVEAGFLLLPLLVSVLYGEPWMPFFATAVLCILIGFILQLVPVKKAQMHSRDGFMAVALGWIALSLTGALPYVFSGALTEYEDAVFETVSGLTTTGSTVFPEVEHLYRSVLLWRSLTQWMGGMGVLVLFLALMPKLGDGAVYLMRAESPGPIKSKLVPKVGGTAKILYTIYLALTVLQIILYRLGGMPIFDSLCNTFGTAGTGGFAIKADSFNSYTAYEQTVTTVFMLLFGVNFSIYFFLLRRKFDLVYKNTELRWYLAIFFSAVTLITINVAPMFPSVGNAIHHVAFSVSSVMTTTGYCTANFDTWPEFSRVILIFLMIIGACAGSATSFILPIPRMGHQALGATCNAMNTATPGRPVRSRSSSTAGGTSCCTRASRWSTMWACG